MRVLVTLLAALTFCGCGFHLPNETSLRDTIPEINLSGCHHHAFFKDVRHELEMSGVKVNLITPTGTIPGREQNADRDPVPGAATRTPELVIAEPTVEIPRVSVDSRGMTLEYNIAINSAATLKIPGHRPLLMRNQITRLRLERTGSSLVTQTQDRDIINETYRELAQQLVLRLSYLGRQSDPDSPVPTPAELTVSAGEDPVTNLSTPTTGSPGMTVMDALQAQDERERANARQVTLDELNHNQALQRERHYQLPRVKPVLVNQAPQNLERDIEIRDPVVRAGKATPEADLHE